MECTYRERRVGTGIEERGFRFVTKRKDKVEELWNLSDQDKFSL